MVAAQETAAKGVTAAKSAIMGRTVMVHGESSSNGTPQLLCPRAQKAYLASKAKVRAKPSATE